MNRKNAIKYLQSKGKIRADPWTKKEEKEIEAVVKKGKIYGDPVAEVDW